MDTKTYEDWSKYLGTKPHRLGVVARMYTDNTLNFITDGLRNVFYKGEKASAYELSSSLVFEWEIETNNIKMRGYSISDFQHGPIAQLHAGDPVFVVALDGPVIDDVDMIIGRLKGIGADIIVITDSDKYCDEDTVTVLKIPSVSEEGIASDALNVFSAAVVFQLFACKLAETKGIDPDASKTLKKITVTV